MTKIDKRKGIRKDFAGQEVGNLYVEKFANENNSSGSAWLATCKCGERLRVSSRTIRRAIQREYPISCGKCEYATRKVNVTPDRAGFNLLYINYKHASNRRGFEFKITPKEFRSLTSKDCHYCGVEPKQISYNSTRKGFYLYNGLDRLDPTKGYTIDNVVPACGVCNIMKQSLDEEEFIQRCAIILKYQANKACPSFDVPKWLKEIGIK